MRRLVGFVLVAAGAVAFLLGAAAAVVFGPDDKINSGPHPLDSDGVAVVTGSSAIHYYGLTIQLDVRADRPSGRVFVAIANAVDVADYLRRSTYTRVDSVRLPWKVATTPVRGSRSPDAPPTDLDVWLDSQSGRPAARITTPLPDAAVALVVMNADGSRGVHVTADLAVEERGMFVGGLAAAVAGIGVVVAGWVFRTPRTREDDPADARAGSQDLPSYGPGADRPSSTRPAGPEVPEP